MNETDQPEKVKPTINHIPNEIQIDDQGHEIFYIQDPENRNFGFRISQWPIPCCQKAEEKINFIIGNDELLRLLCELAVSEAQTTSPVKPATAITHWSLFHKFSDRPIVTYNLRGLQTSISESQDVKTFLDQCFQFARNQPVHL